MLLASSATFLVLPESLLGLPMSGSSGIYRLWVASLELLAVPVCLLLLCFTKSTLIRVTKLLWGLWMTILSACVLLLLNEVAPEVTLWGTVHVGVTLITALSLTLFCTIELSKLAPPKKEEDPLLDNSLTPPLEGDSAELARKVEGA